MRDPECTASLGGTLGLPVIRALVHVSADGLAVLDRHCRFVEVNPAGYRILGFPSGELLGRTAPFGVFDGTSQPGSDARRQTQWLAGDGRYRSLEYQITSLADGMSAVWFTDVTETLRQQERLSAITRAAASVAASGSLRATLEAMAQEVWMTANINAVQILALDNPHEELRVVGMAGFGDARDFIERLSQCSRLGADIRFREAIERAQPVIVLHRKPVIMRDPAWAPLQEIMGYPDWDSFVSMPLVVRGSVVGVINAYYVPGEDPGPSSLAFLSAMADHAALAIENASLLAQTRSRAQMDERRKLARDLHDSAVQQLFSMGMQGRALRARLDQQGVDPAQLRDGVQELVGLARNALADLRGLVFELHPLDLAERGLIDAVRAYAASLEARSSLVIDTRISDDLDLDLGIDVEEDLYRIVQEALHNVVKHADATRVDIELARSPDHERAVTLRITDDGRANSAGSDSPQPNLGLVSMRERAERWRGSLVAGRQPDGGWMVAVTLPAPGGTGTGRGGAHLWLNE